jgi:hypothetical protein
MPLFRRKPKPAKPLPPPSEGLHAGEEIERNTKATLLQGKDAIDGVLHMTDRRLMFEAHKGEARWMIVPYDEIKSAGIYPFQRYAGPSSRARCLVVETTQGEQVWWDFGDEEQEWLPLVQAKLSVRAPEDDDAP